MNKKLLLTIFGLGLTLSSIAQNIQIKVDNSEPRVNQEIRLSIETKFFEDLIKTSLEDGVEFKESYFQKDFTKTIVVKKEGPMTIGPLSFTFNGKEYISNEITINVIPSLSDKAGVWVRKVKMDNKEYILIEQIVVRKSTTSTFRNSITTSWQSFDEIELAELNEEFKNEDIVFYENRSGNGGHPDESKNYPLEIGYAYKFYEIQPGPNFSGNFKLTKRHFRNLPKGTKITPITITDRN